MRALDFEEIVIIASDGDFVFADPPYTVKHNANGFIKYNEKLFLGGPGSASRCTLAGCGARRHCVVDERRSFLSSRIVSGLQRSHAASTQRNGFGVT